MRRRKRETDLPRRATKATKTLDMIACNIVIIIIIISVILVAYCMCVEDDVVVKKAEK